MSRRWMPNRDDALELKEGGQLLAGVYLQGGHWKAVRYRHLPGDPIQWELVSHFEGKREAMVAAEQACAQP